MRRRSRRHPSGRPALVALVLICLSLCCSCVQQAIADDSEGACVPDNLVGSDNVQKAYNFFLATGLKDFQAAGIVGNMIAESGVLPERLENTPTTQLTSAETAVNIDTGWGIVQWTPASKMIRPAHDHGRSYDEINSLEYQLKVVLGQITPHPIDGIADNPTTYGRVKASSSIKAATDAFMLGFERPKDQSQDRSPLAQQVLDRYGKSSGGGQGGVDAALPGSCGGGDGDSGSDGKAVQDCPTDGKPVPESSTTTTTNGIRVNKCVVDEANKMIAAAKGDHITLSATSAYRSRAEQIALRKKNCGTSQYAVYQEPAESCSPPTAIPGTSNHEGGLAIDFQLSCGDATFTWLKSNASKYHFSNLPSECWHWSIDGH